MAFYELRQYKVLPGKMDQWVKFMEDEIIPFQVSKGMVICGSFRHETDESVYIWIRRFESEEHRVKLYAAVYESAYWKERIAPPIPSMLDRSAMVVQRIVPTALSILQ
ncbi:MAG TPA: NIPSNAP family protein [Rhodopila sp.]|uniref:NIPSNAP family protein n=1 Tax=Rhodopila sp. TaxID=2480087 RepID=UPI002CDE4ED5|nr:NIPSNAP family protein [Rhodopila sp.]HVY15877.1 NIPSNAP family protein [Rhodopila sp.]